MNPDLMSSASEWFTCRQHMQLIKLHLEWIANYTSWVSEQFLNGHEVQLKEENVKGGITQWSIKLHETLSTNNALALKAAHAFTYFQFHISALHLHFLLHIYTGWVKIQVFLAVCEQSSWNFAMMQGTFCSMQRHFLIVCIMFHYKDIRD